MTDHENKNTQHRSSAGETTPLHESRLATFLQKLGKRSLKLLDTARLIYRYGPPLPPYRKEGQPATPEEMDALNNVLSTVAARAEAANAAPTHTTAHDSINPLHHEVVLTHEGSTQDVHVHQKPVSITMGSPSPSEHGRFNIYCENLELISKTPSHHLRISERVVSWCIVT